MVTCDAMRYDAMTCDVALKKITQEKHCVGSLF